MRGHLLRLDRIAEGVRGRGGYALLGRRLIVTSTIQAGGHPWVDEATTTSSRGERFRSWAIRPSFRRRANRVAGWALVVGWRR